MKAKTIGYERLGTDSSSSELVPSLAAGLGTRIAHLADLIGDREKASHVMNISPASLHRYMRETNMPPFDVAARLCLAAGKSLHWLATGAEGQAAAPSQPVRLDTGALRSAVEAVDTALAAIGVDVRPADRAELYAKAYELLEGATSVAQATAQVLKLIMGGKR